MTKRISWLTATVLAGVSMCITLIFKSGKFELINFFSGFKTLKVVRTQTSDRLLYLNYYNNRQNIGVRVLILEITRNCVSGLTTTDFYCVLFNTSAVAAVKWK